MEPLRYIGEDGSVERDLPEGLGRDGALEMFRSMLLLRAFDERAVSLQRQGRIGTYPLFWGEESTQAGVVHAIEPRDWLFPSYRQSAIAVLRGLAPSTIYKYRRGHGGPSGFWDPREYRVTPIAISIATHLPHAVGLSWAAKMRGEPLVAVVWFGDGATSEGDFHEAMNIAAVWRTPTVFFCVNNQWAISTPFHKQTATATIAEKAVGYGMPASRVDGFDPIACWYATRTASVRAREGAGPTLIEAFCYRLGPHGTADDPGLYRDEEITARWRHLEPLGRTARYLRLLGVLDDPTEERLRAEVRSEIGRAVEELDAAETPSTDVLFDHVYGSQPPWTLEEGAAELLATLEDRR